MVLCTVRKIDATAQPPVLPTQPVPFLDKEPVRSFRQRRTARSESAEWAARIVSGSGGVAGAHSTMPEVSVVIVASDSEQRAVLQVLVDSTSVARAVHSAGSFPTVARIP